MWAYLIIGIVIGATAALFFCYLFFTAVLKKKKIN
jgi:hypothetical protein